MKTYSTEKNKQMNSRYEPFDTNKDGVIDADEIESLAAATDVENRNQKEDQQRKMAWIAMISMIVFTAFLFLPIMPIDRVESLSDLLSMFYIAQAGVVATFFGAQAYLNK